MPDPVIRYAVLPDLWMLGGIPDPWLLERNATGRGDYVLITLDAGSFIISMKAISEAVARITQSAVQFTREVTAAERAARQAAAGIRLELECRASIQDRTVTTRPSGQPQDGSGG